MNARELHILVADDNAVNQKVLGHMLKRMGHRVETADTGQEAVFEAASLRYDLIFMDLKMPVMDGLEATRIIRSGEAGKSRTPIVAVTASVERSDEQACAEAGMDAFLTKPFTLDQVRTCVDRFDGARFSNPDSKGLNPAHLEAFIQTMGADDLAFVLEVLGDLLSEANRCRATIQDALDRNEPEVVIRATHSLKSAASVVGADQLAGLCQHFENAAKFSKLDEIRLAFPKFDGALNEVRKDVQAFTAQHASPSDA